MDGPDGIGVGSFEYCFMMPILVFLTTEDGDGAVGEGTYVGTYAEAEEEDEGEEGE